MKFNQETTDSFTSRHIGPSKKEVDEMLKVVGVESLDALVEETIPSAIRLKKPLKLSDPTSEYAFLENLLKTAKLNQVFKSYIGLGYYDCFTPGVIRRNILENPGWYTQYTPYQAEISQGRLEALLHFQTMVADLTKMEIANASLLDEGTAAAEAMTFTERAPGLEPEISDATSAWGARGTALAELGAGGITVTTPERDAPAEPFAAPASASASDPDADVAATALGMRCPSPGAVGVPGVDAVGEPTDTYVAGNATTAGATWRRSAFITRSRPRSRRGR